MRFGLDWLVRFFRDNTISVFNIKIELKGKEYIQTNCVFLQFWFELVRFAIFLLDWFGFERPYTKQELYGQGLSRLSSLTNNIRLMEIST